MGSFFSRLLTLSGMLLALTAAAEDGALGPEEKADTNSIVQAALQAEVDGDTSRREVLLTRALERNSKHLPARWHSGHVQSEDRWLTLEEAEGGDLDPLVARGCVVQANHVGSTRSQGR